jgi:hypothetical protein
MTLGEVATQAPGLGLGREASTWQSLGDRCWITVLGRVTKQGQPAVIASLIYDEETEQVRALELAGTAPVMWIDPEYRDSFLEEIQSRGLSLPRITDDWITQLSLLGDLARQLELLTGEQEDDDQTKDQ